MPDYEKEKGPRTRYNVTSRICTLETLEALMQKNIIDHNTVLKTKYSVKFNDRQIIDLPIEFSNVSMSFEARNCGLMSLKRSPRKVHHNFEVSHNKLESLEHGPTHVQQHYQCSYNPLKTLEFLPQYAASMSIDNCGLTSLVGIHKTLKQCGTLSFRENKIDEGGIGLLLIPTLRTINCAKNSVDCTEAMAIIRKYLRVGKAGLLQCADELEEAGLARFAKL